MAVLLNSGLAKGYEFLLIMSRVDEQATITLCQSPGISMFRGFPVDDMVSPQKAEAP